MNPTPYAALPPVHDIWNGVLWGIAYAVIFYLIVISALTTINWLTWQYRRRIERRRDHALKFRPDGLPYPPRGRGLCHSCSRAFDVVYYLPSGRQLCQ